MSKDDKTKYKIDDPEKGVYIKAKGRTSEELQRLGLDKKARGQSTLASSSQGIKNLDTKKLLHNDRNIVSGNIPAEDRSIQPIKNAAEAAKNTEQKLAARAAVRAEKFGIKGLDGVFDVAKKLGKSGLKALGPIGAILGMATGLQSGGAEAAESFLPMGIAPSVMGDATIKPRMSEQYEKDQAELKAARLKKESQDMQEKPNRFSNFRF